MPPPFTHPNIIRLLLIVIVFIVIVFIEILGIIIVFVILVLVGIFILIAGPPTPSRSTLCGIVFAGGVCCWSLVATLIVGIGIATGRSPRGGRLVIRWHCVGIFGIVTVRKKVDIVKISSLPLPFGAHLVGILAKSLGPVGCRAVLYAVASRQISISVDAPLLPSPKLPSFDASTLQRIISQ